MLQKPKGTYDVYGTYGKKILYLENLIKALMEKYNYQYCRTPLFETREVFYRGVGQDTDIVSKETYDFEDRGNRLMTLRPEGTAGVVRSYIENKIYGNSSMPNKIWYYGPMYRYERPQSGRFREFYQFGVEVFGSKDPLIDAEIISIPVVFFKLIGLKGIKVNINSLGDTESRQQYKQTLLDYFKPHLETLCEDCQKRYANNPLRILDCKVDADKEVLKNAPRIVDSLNEYSKKHFNKVQEYLNDLGVEFEVNSKIVRGLDYYTHTVFEVKADIKDFGSQNVLCGGGRYDNLVEKIGGPQTSGIGFAIGMERLIAAIDAEKIELDYTDFIDVYLIPMSENEKSHVLDLTQTLRLNGFNCDMDYMNRNLKSNFKQSEKIKAKYVIIVGDDEIKNNLLTIKDNKTKEEYKVNNKDIISFLDEKLGEVDEEV